MMTDRLPMKLKFMFKIIFMSFFYIQINFITEIPTNIQVLHQRETGWDA